MKRVVALVANRIKNRGILGLRWDDEWLPAKHTGIPDEPCNGRWNDDRTGCKAA